MATLASMPDFVHVLEHERMSKGHWYQLSHLSLSSNGNIAVSSKYHDELFQTFVDLYCENDTPSSWNKFRLLYSKEFDRFYGNRDRKVAFLGNESHKIITCIGRKIEIINTANKSQVLRSRRVNRIIRCVYVREGEIFIGFNDSRTLVVFNNDLEETNKIILQGIEDSEILVDLQVTKDTVVLCTQEKALAIRELDGSTLTKYSNTTEKDAVPKSIAVSEELGLATVLWEPKENSQIIVYPFNKQKALLIVNGVSRSMSVIRLSARDKMIITGNSWNSTISMYYLEDLFTYDHMKENICLELTREDCLELSSLFKVSRNSLDPTLESDTSPKSLLRALEECDVLQPSDVDAFADALVKINLSSCFNIVDIYRKTRRDYKLKTSHNGSRGELKTNEVTEDDGPVMAEGLETEIDDKIKTKGLKSKVQDTLKRELEVTQRALKETRIDRDKTLYELKQNQLDLAKESKALEEVLKHSKQHMDKLEKRTTEGKSEDNYSPTRLKDMQDKEALLLAAQFGRLIIGIADSLTLDHSLKLSLLFNLPLPVTKVLHRVSLLQTPGIKLLNEIRDRKIINMYDITNLQKALKMLELDEVNLKLVNPYQEKVNDDQHKLHKAEEIFTWDDIKTFSATKDDTSRENKEEDISVTLEDDVGGQSKENQEHHPIMNVEERSSSLKDRRHLLSYIEHNVGREGGSIHLAGAILTIPSDALVDNHVIGLSITTSPPFPLPMEVDRARMTPLIKLEPLGLMFQKHLQLTIPHSALIPEPKRHDVIIYSGQMSTNTGQNLEHITWTEEKFLPRQLQEKSVMVDIQRLSYFSASLVSQPSAPSVHIVRVVPFIDGVRNFDDDITLTICFCIDNDIEYTMLLSDYQNKLLLEQYSTLHLFRHSERGENDSTLSVTVSSVSKAYIPDTEQAVKTIDVSHLCTASRVSHQFILRKNRDIKSDLVDVKLTFFQSMDKATDIFLKSRVKDLMVSQEIEERLSGCVPPDLKPYEDLKEKISSTLETLHCRNLATYFGLTPAELERVESNSNPGRLLVKILDEREKIMPNKMIDLFQGLKACHLDKIARQVSEYIDQRSVRIRQETQQHEEKSAESKGIQNDESYSHQPKTTPQRRVGSSQSDRYVSHVKTLVEEGYEKQNVEKALDISNNRIVIARRVLKCIEEPCEVLPKRDIFLYKEQYIDQNGGEVTLLEANTHMLIPVGAVSRGSIVTITMVMDKHVNIPLEGRTTRLTPVIKCGQEGLSLNTPITLRIPHCIAETEGITAIDMYLGFCNEGNEIQWRKRKQHEPRPFLKKDHFGVHLHQFCAVSLSIAVDYQKALGKRMRVLPLINQVLNHSDDLKITLMFYNDDETEHLYLLHELNVNGKIQLHDFKSFTLKGSDKDKQVNVVSGDNKIIPHPNDINIKRISTTRLFQNTRYSVEFIFQNKDEIKDISFKIRLCSKQFFRTVDDLQFDVKVTLTELSQQSHGSTSGLLKSPQLHPAMGRSFQELVSELSGQLDVDSCLEIARSFGLFATLSDTVKCSCDPGTLLFDELLQQQLISASHVSALDIALIKSGNEHLADVVREYRRRNATLPTTVLSL